MTPHIRRIETNYAHDSVTVKAIKEDDQAEIYTDTVEIVFAGRDPATVTLRFTDLRDVRAIGQALIDATNYLAPNETTRSDPVREALQEMVDMIDSGDEHGAGSEWHQAAIRALSTPSPEVAKPVGWLHTLHMELGQVQQRFTFSEQPPFGKPGKDYSPEYSVTSERVFTSSQK